MAEHKKVQCYISASSVTDIFYLTKKTLTDMGAKQAIENLMKLFEVVEVNKSDLMNALAIAIYDFEDALQAHCAEKIAADMIITRDLAGFSGFGISAVSPNDFVQ